MKEIPLTSIPSQEFNVILGGQHCTISLYWRQVRLYLDLMADSHVICRGAICQNKAEIVQSRTQGFKGSLYFLDLEGDRPPHWERLNTRYVLLYLEEGEDDPFKAEGRL